MRRDALISGPAEEYRYWLTRVWDESLPMLCVVMLNPSTAVGEVDDSDQDPDDPTVKGLIRKAKHHGFGSFIIVNLYAFRTPSPKALKKAGYPVGPDNDKHIREAVRRSQAVMCGWGANAQPRRARQVYDLVKSEGATPCAMRVTKSGQPGHPLYIKDSAPLIEWTAPA